VRLARRGDWAWLADACELTPAAQFVLATALAGRIDASIGAVCAACQNDASRPWPTLALAQRLWDDPLAVAACADAGHVLFRHGLLGLAPGREALDWQQALDMPSLVAHALLEQDAAPAQPSADLAARALPASLRPLLARLRSAPPVAMQILPLQAPRGTDFAAWARALAHAEGRALAIVADDVEPERGLAALATASWLRGVDLLLPEHWQESCCAAASEHWVARVSALPLRWYLPAVDGAAAARGVPHKLLLPACVLPTPDVAARIAVLDAALAHCAPALRAAVPEAARRFRLAELPLRRVAKAATELDAQAGAAELFEVCRAEARLELDGLANPVAPRFELHELVLAPAQAQQLREIVAAMGALGRVHHEWGTARAWNEGGLSVLFCGPPGTGKTMAAEALASELKLPMVRIDLSQVVNKYIGETEKNLRRIFDAAETSDCLMFFDEADALFGKRTEVKDAHDRFANIEVSYLLERMERFKGLAVLASNRRKDLDEAFTRRLRHIVEFAMPGPGEREQLWRLVFPAQVDISSLDIRWLAQQFEMAGGHIRSAAFNACLLAASAQGAGEPARVDMPHALVAIKRELEKMSRVAGREQFGRYAALLGSTA
jgi:vesicle-fusing ATPase